MIINFEEIKITAKKTGKCLCGKRHSYSKSFSQTLNPFNKIDGRLKTRKEINDELMIERQEWLKKPIYCKFPDYWQWTKEEREIFDKNGEIIVSAECGIKTKILK